MKNIIITYTFAVLLAISFSVSALQVADDFKIPEVKNEILTLPFVISNDRVYRDVKIELKDYKVLEFIDSNCLKEEIPGYYKTYFSPYLRSPKPFCIDIFK